MGDDDEEGGGCLACIGSCCGCEREAKCSEASCPILCTFVASLFLTIGAINIDRGWLLKPAECSKGTYFNGGDGWGSGGDENEEDPNDPAVEIENSYYEGEALMKDQPSEALTFFEKCASLEEEQGKGITHGFNATQRIVILCARLNQFDKMKAQQQKIISMMKSVSRNDTEEAISNILDAVSKHMSDKPVQAMEIYYMTMEAVKSENETLWFKISLRLGKIYLEQQDFAKLDELLGRLKLSCRLKQAQEADGDQIMEPSMITTDQYDPAKSNLLLETFAIEIQMCQVTKDKKRMNRVYPQTTKLIAVINDPRVMGIIKECGGKMYMAEKKWALALDELHDCFKNYQEGGNLKAKNILVYVILASILAKSEIDFTSSREAQVYSDDKDVIAITQLKNAYLKNDIKRIQAILNDKKNKIFSDAEFMLYLDDLLRNIRLNVLMFKVKPYEIVKLDFLARELNINVKEVKQLLAELILDGKIDGAIDQQAGLLEINQANALDARYNVMTQWSEALQNLNLQFK